MKGILVGSAASKLIHYGACHVQAKPLDLYHTAESNWYTLGDVVDCDSSTLIKHMLSANEDPYSKVKRSFRDC